MMTSTRSGRPALPRGFSMIELMIAIAVGLFLLAGILNLFVSTSRGFQVQQSYSRLQENGRNALQLVGHDLRMAGFSGCSRNNRFNNNLNNPGSNWWNPTGGVNGLFTAAVIGVEHDEALDGIATGTSPGQRASHTDAVQILLGGSEFLRIHKHTPASAKIEFTGGPIAADPGSLWIVCNAEITTMLEMSGPASGSISHIVHNTGAGTPGNCTKDLDRTCPVAAPAPASSNYDITSRPPAFLISVSPLAYYIGISRSCSGVSGCSLRSLFRAQRLANGTWLQEEVVEGIYDMELVYGQTDGEADETGQVVIKPMDAYANAEDVANWSTVNTVSVRLLTQLNLNNSATEARTYSFNGQSYKLPNNAIGQEMSFVVGLRNYLK